MDYKKFELADFLKDEYFVRWVNHPDKETEGFWKSVLERYPEKESTMVKARQLVTMLHYKNEFKLDSEERKVLKTALKSPKLIQPETFRDYSSMVFKVAASVLILLASGVCFWYISNGLEENTVADIQSNRWQIEEVGRGKKVSYVLADGTRIKMNSSSKCSFPSQYEKGKVREFRLIQGEIFFDVAEDSTSPFIVYTGETATRVLGTSFNIKHDTAQQKVEVALVTGKVSVDHAEDKLQLTPGEKININPDNIIKSSFDALLVTGWKDGVLVIDELPFNSMIGKLEQWYGVDFNIEPTVDTTGIYKGIYRNQSLENVLLGMGFTSELDFEIKKNNVFLN